MRPFAHDFFFNSIFIRCDFAKLPHNYSVPSKLKCSSNWKEALVKSMSRILGIGWFETSNARCGWCFSLPLFDMWNTWIPFTCRFIPERLKYVDRLKFHLLKPHSQFVWEMLSIRPFNQLDNRSFFMDQLIFHALTHTHIQTYRTHGSTYFRKREIHSLFFLRKNQTNFIVEMKSLNWNSSIFHMQNTAHIHQKFQRLTHTTRVTQFSWYPSSIVSVCVCVQTFGVFMMCEKLYTVLTVTSSKRYRINLNNKCALSQNRISKIMSEFKRQTNHSHAQNEWGDSGLVWFGRKFQPLQTGCFHRTEYWSVNLSFQMKWNGGKTLI